MRYVVLSFDLSERTIISKKYVWECDTKQEALNVARYWVDCGYCPCILTAHQYGFYQLSATDK